MTGIAFLLGILAGQFAADLPNLTLIAMLLPCVAWLGWRWPRARLPAAALLGFCWLSLWAHLRLADELPQQLERRDLVVSGHVVGLPQHQSTRSRFLFRIESAQFDSQPVELDLLTRISWYHGERPRAGERWQLTLRLKRPRGFANPHGFDYAGWLFRHDIRATGYVRNQGDNQRLDGHANSQVIHRLRESLVVGLTESLPEAQQPALLHALSVGERHAIDESLWQSLRATGTNHLLAISGLHIGLVAGLFAFFAARLWRFAPWLMRRCAQRDFALALALPAAFAYAALAGFSLPTQRALIMLLVAAAVLLLRRHVSAWRGGSLALLAVLVCDPFAPMGADFWLSFGAVAVIIFTLSGRSVAESRWRQTLRIQLTISFGLLPLTLFFFGSGSLISPIANTLAIPLVGFLIAPPLLLGAAVSAFSPSIAQPLLWLADQAADALVRLLHWLSALPLAQWQPGSPAIWAALLALLAAAIAFSPARLLPRWLAIPLCLPLIFPPNNTPPRGQFDLHLLDVGQGLSAVIRTREHVLLFDAGARFSARFNAGDAVVLPFLLGEGVRRLDTVIVSHSDNDHRGGVPAVLARLPADRILASFDWRETQQPMERCSAGQHWQWDGVRFEIIHPAPAEATQSDNNGACVLRVVAADGASALLPADIEVAAELALVTRGLPQSELLIAPHHGSNTSSTQAFIDAVNPQVVLLPIGHANRYGFPHDAVLARYRSRAVRLFRSDRDGALHFRLGDGMAASAIQPRQSARDTRRYWQDIWEKPRKSSIIAPLERPSRATATSHEE